MTRTPDFPEPLQPGPSDLAVEELIARLLRVGIALSGALVLIGGLIALIKTAGSPIPDLSTLEPSSRLLSPSELAQGVLSLDPLALVQAGLVVLIATPVMRVAVSAYGFLRQRDWLYVGITLVVLAVLVFGLVAGQG